MSPSIFLNPFNLSLICQTILKYFYPLPDRDPMKTMMMILILLSTSINAQNHGSGGSERNHGDIAFAQKCEEVNVLVVELVKKFNTHRSRFKQITNYSQFIEEVQKVALEVQFKELGAASEKELRVKCGEKQINKILNKNPWLLDKDIHALFAQVVKTDQKAKCSGKEHKEVAPYVDFLKIWTKQEVPNFSPIDINEHQMNNPGMGEGRG